MKKSELHSQIFIYILTLVLISFIVIYGYNAIKNFKKRAEQISCLKFKNDLGNAVESVSSDFGSVKRKDLQLCADYTQVCFVESFDKLIMPSGTDPVIRDSISSKSGKNVFLVSYIAKESYDIGKISVEPDVLCIKSVNNKISLRLEGKGDHVDLRQWG